MSFEGKVAVVTGAASGIGEATAKLLASKGAKVVVADVLESQAQRVVSEIHAEGGAAAFVRTDVSSNADARGMVDFAVSTFGGLHLAVNNAGIGQPPGTTADMDESVFDRVIAIDLKGTWLCLRAEVNHFLANGGGAIVNTGSIAGLRPADGQPAYSIAKHGVVGLTRQAAKEFVSHNIRVNAVAPGLIETPLVLSLPEETRAGYAARQPAGRLGTAAEVAGAIAWLLSDEASFVTGVIHTVDGGSTLG